MAKETEIVVEKEPIRLIEDHCKDVGIEVTHWKYKALFGYFGFVTGKAVTKKSFDAALNRVVYGKIG